MKKADYSVSSLIRHLESIRVLDCALTHEKVLLYPNTAIPVKLFSEQNSDFKRRSICHAKKRDHLGCAHSIARASLIKKLKVFSANVPAYSNDISHLVKQLQGIEMEIIETDLSMSNVELKCAELLQEQANSPQLSFVESMTEINNNRTNTVHRHNEINHRIRRLIENLLVKLRQATNC